MKWFPVCCCWVGIVYGVFGLYAHAWGHDGSPDVTQELHLPVGTIRSQTSLCRLGQLLYAQGAYGQAMNVWYLAREYLPRDAWLQRSMQSAAIQAGVTLVDESDSWWYWCALRWLTPWQRRLVHLSSMIALSGTLSCVLWFHRGKKAFILGSCLILGVVGANVWYCYGSTRCVLLAPCVFRSLDGSALTGQRLITCWSEGTHVFGTTPQGKVVEADPVSLGRIVPPW